jgi:hypothetical protein
MFDKNTDHCTPKKVFDGPMGIFDGVIHHLIHHFIHYFIHHSVQGYLGNIVLHSKTKTTISRSPNFKEQESTYFFFKF